MDKGYEQVIIVKEMAWKNVQVFENWKFKQEDIISHHEIFKNIKVLTRMQENGNTIHGYRNVENWNNHFGEQLGSIYNFLSVGLYSKMVLAFMLKKAVEVIYCGPVYNSKIKGKTRESNLNVYQMWINNVAYVHKTEFI